MSSPPPGDGTVASDPLTDRERVLVVSRASVVAETFQPPLDPIVLVEDGLAGGRTGASRS